MFLFNYQKAIKLNLFQNSLLLGYLINLGFFKFKVTNTGKTVNINSIIQINSPIIAPNYYSSLKEFYTKVVAKQKEQIVLVKG